MLPSKSNNKENCSPTSSNCVVWQGPNIACINLCTGDSVSDVVYKLAEEICTLKENAGISDVDLTCLVSTCVSVSPEPSKTLSNILQLLIDKVCCIDEFVKDINIPDDPYQEPTLTLPCAYLQYSDGMGGTVTQLPLNQYVVRLATMICDLNTRVTDNTSDIDDLTDRVVALETAVDAPVQIDSCLSGTLVDIDDAVENLETQVCSYITALGPVSKITQIAPLQCVTGSDIALSTGSPMALQPGWEPTVSNLAQSLKNLWATVCDIRGAVKLIQDNCCKVDCSDIEIDFYQRWSTEIDEEGTLLLNFKAKSKFLNGFYDCGQTLASPNTSTNQLLFTDANGLPITVPILFRSINYPTDVTGALDSGVSGWYAIDLSGTGLDLNKGPLTVTADLCFTNGTLECIKCYTWTIQPFVGSCCEITATGDVTLTYSICEVETTPPDFNQLVNDINNNPLSFSPTPPCDLTYVTVNLTAGQVFVIPQGATVTYISDPTKAQSTCIDLQDIPTDPPGPGCGTGVLSAITSNASSTNCVAGDGDLNIIDYVDGDPHCGISGTVCIDLNPSGPGSCSGSFVVKVIVNGIITYTSGTYTVGNTTVCVPVSATSSQNVTILFDFPF